MVDILMKEAAQRLINFTMEKYPENIEVLNDGIIIAYVAVSIDGTWQMAYFGHRKLLFCVTEIISKFNRRAATKVVILKKHVCCTTKKRYP